MGEGGGVSRNGGGAKNGEIGLGAGGIEYEISRDEGLV